MLQLMDLAKENAALKCELERVRREAKALRLRLEEDSAPTSQLPWSRQSMSDTDEVKEKLEPGAGVEPATY
jgi:hypothetical protein